MHDRDFFSVSFFNIQTLKYKVKVNADRGMQTGGPNGKCVYK